jgi:hypothetical protein
MESVKRWTEAMKTNQKQWDKAKKAGKLQKRQAKKVIILLNTASC